MVKTTLSSGIRTQRRHRDSCPLAPRRGAARLRTSSPTTPAKRSELGLAGSTGLEPAASGVTGRRSNQLNYDPKLFTGVCRSQADLKVGLYAPAEARRRRTFCWPAEPKLVEDERRLVGGAGLEPATPGV